MADSGAGDGPGRKELPDAGRYPRTWAEQQHWLPEIRGRAGWAPGSEDHEERERNVTGAAGRRLGATDGAGEGWCDGDHDVCGTKGSRGQKDIAEGVDWRWHFLASFNILFSFSPFYCSWFVFAG